MTEAGVSTWQIITVIAVPAYGALFLLILHAFRRILETREKITETREKIAELALELERFKTHAAERYVAVGELGSLKKAVNDRLDQIAAELRRLGERLAGVAVKPGSAR
jgi:hypothetical protein